MDERREFDWAMDPLPSVERTAMVKARPRGYGGAVCGLDIWPGMPAGG